MRIKYLAFLLLISVIIMSCNQQEQVYVDSNEVMENFEFYKEFEKEYKNRLTFSKTYLDSILYDLSVEERFIENNNTDDIHLQNKERYYLLKEEHSEALNLFYEEEMQKIMLRLNGYFEDYGNEMQYDYILGANGQGVMLYADSTKNITKQFINYSNERYNGVN